MSETIRVFDINSLDKLRGEYKCTSSKTITTGIPVIINGKLINMKLGFAGTDYINSFKSYADSTYTELYSYMFLIYLTTGDYNFITGAGNFAFLSFSSSPIKDSTLYNIPSGTYVCQVFVNAGYKFSFSLKKKYAGSDDVVKNIYEYALKCENVETEDLIYDEFYNQILESCAAGETSGVPCDRILSMNIMSDPRFYLSTKYNNNKAGTTITGEWTTVENTCPTTCGVGSKKISRNILKYLSRGAAEKTVETNTVDCSTLCPVDGYFSSWGSWSTCSKDCGGGTQTRYRSYTPAVNGGVDLTNRYVTSETRNCNTDPCGLTKVPATKIIDRNTHTYNVVDVKSPNGQYRFVWQPKGFSAQVYKLSGGIWSSISSVNILNSTKTAALGCYASVFASYNSSITTPAVIAKTTMDYQRVMLTNDGNIIFEDRFGEPVDIALAPGTKFNTQ